MLRVRESVWGSGYLRVIEVSLRVFPGVRVESNNRASTEPPPSLEEMRAATSVIRRQLRVWAPFTYRERTGAERTFRYEFQVRVETTEDPTPVNGWVPQVGRSMEVPSPHGRSVRSALEEARRRGMHNAAVIPTSLIGDPNSPYVRDDGTFERRDRETLHGYLLRASNVMVVGLDKLKADGNQTAAHEMGHMFGLWHQGQGGSIMRWAREGQQRRLLPEDQEALHWSVETPRTGIEWGMRVSGPLPLTARRPLGLVYR